MSRQDVLRADENRLNGVVRAFEEIALASMEESMELHLVLQAIGRRLIELLQISRCTVYLRRGDGRFACHAGWSAAGDMGHLVSRLVSGGDRLTKEAVATRKPILAKDAVNHPLTDHEAMIHFGVRDILAVPMVLAGEVIGVIYVDNEDRDHTYGTAELATAQAFASLAAIAVRQVELRDELDQHNAVIQHKNQQLRKIATISRMLSDATLKGADTDDLLTLVEGFLHRPVVLYSADLNVLAWKAPSSLKLAHPPALPQRARDLQVVRQLRSAEDTSPALLPSLPAIGSPHRRLLAPIVVERRRVGYLEAVEFGRPFVDLEREILDRAAVAIALQLQTESRRAESEAQARSDFLADILNGERDSDSLRRAATARGISPDGTYRLLRVRYGHGDEQRHTGRARRQGLLDLLSERLDLDGLVDTSIPGGDILLLEERPGIDLAERLEPLRPDLEAIGVLHLVLSLPQVGLVSMSAAATELRDMERALLELGARPQLLRMDRAGVLQMLLQDTGIGRAQEFAVTLLAPLLRTDQNDVLIETIRVFLAVNCHIRAASRTLGVHENTVRYRVGKAGEAMGVDLNDFTDAFKVRLALQVHDLLPPP
ncbi:GAF domain-containing protein [Nocardioides dokdonensis]|nr:GAF domain-containing protein [Nocardioides dokdonensis]